MILPIFPRCSSGISPCPRRSTGKPCRTGCNQWTMIPRYFGNVSTVRCHCEPVRAWRPERAARGSTLGVRSPGTMLQICNMPPAGVFLVSSRKTRKNRHKRGADREGYRYIVRVVPFYPAFEPPSLMYLSRPPSVADYGSAVGQCAAKNRQRLSLRACDSRRGNLLVRSTEVHSRT